MPQRGFLLYSRLNFSKFTNKFIPPLDSKTLCKKIPEDYRYYPGNTGRFACRLSLLVQSPCKTADPGHGGIKIKWKD